THGLERPSSVPICVLAPCDRNLALGAVGVSPRSRRWANRGDREAADSRPMRPTLDRVLAMSAPGQTGQWTPFVPHVPDAPDAPVMGTGCSITHQVDGVNQRTALTGR